MNTPRIDRESIALSREQHRARRQDRLRLARALGHEAHAQHLRAGEIDLGCPHCVVERPWQSVEEE